MSVLRAANVIHFIYITKYLYANLLEYFYSFTIFQRMRKNPSLLHSTFYLADSKQETAVKDE